MSDEVAAADGKKHARSAGSRYIAYDSEQAIEARRVHETRRAYRRWSSYSWRAWLFDVDPEDLYPDAEFPRTPKQEVRRQWLRAHTSWAFLGRFQTAFALRLAPALPVTALLIQQVPELRGVAPIRTFGWCVLSAVLWIVACLVYQLLAPRLMKATTSTYAGQEGASRRQLLAGLITEEFDRLVTVRLWPVPALIDDLGFNHRNDRMALEMQIAGLEPVVVGFGLAAQARIERALLFWAAGATVRVIERRGRRWELLERRTSLEGRWPVAQTLSLRVAGQDETGDGDLPNAGDLLIEWSESTLDSLVHFHAEQADGRPRMTINGLARFLEQDERANAMGELVAQWANWRHPWSRFGLLALYGGVLAMASLFLVLQTVTVIQAMW